jgi:hypothetical protein
MPSPFDYSLNQQGNALMSGYDSGYAQAQQAQEQARQQEMQRMAEAVKLQQQQQQVALQNRIASVADALSNGTATGNQVISLMVAAPHLSEGFKRAYDAQGESGQKALKSAGFQIDAALDAGDTAVLNTVLDRNIEAFKNSGDPATANSLATIKKVAEADPGRAKLLAKMFNASIDPKYAENLGKLGAEARAAESAPVELATAKAKQTVAEAEAGVAGEKARLGIDVLKQDIEWKKQDSKIKLMQAAAAREGNDLKRRELGIKIDEAVQARDQKARDLQADVDNKLAGTASTLGVVQDIRRLGSGGLATAVLGQFPGTDASAANRKIEQLKSQLTLENTKYLKGAMSDADIKLLANAATSLSNTSGGTEFNRELAKIEATLKRADAAVRKQYNLPSDYTPAGAPAQFPAQGYGPIPGADVRSQADAILKGK